MNSTYRNDRYSFRQHDQENELDAESRNNSRMRHGISWGPPPGKEEETSRHYGRDNASMRGNDYYGTQGYTNDYSRGNYSASTYGHSDYSISAKRGEYGSGENVRGLDRKEEYIEFPDYSNRPTYGSYAGSRAYTDFMNYNYGYSGYSAAPATSSGSGLKRERTGAESGEVKASGTRTRLRSANQSRYGENDGRRR